VFVHSAGFINSSSPPTSLSSNSPFSSNSSSDLCLYADRRSALRTCITLTLSPSLANYLLPTAGANAVVTDETNNWAGTDRGNAYIGSTDFSKVPPPATVTSKKAVPSDEFTVMFGKEDILNNSLGIELQNVEFRTNRRVQVKAVQEGSIADLLGVSKFLVVVAVNGESTERTDAKGVQFMVSKAIQEIRNGKVDKDLEIIFRDPEIFLNQLRNIEEGEVVTTQVAPSGDTTQRTQSGKAKGDITSQDEQRYSVTQVKPPVMCNRRAQTDDLLEISYVGSIVETGLIFDGSAVTIDGKGIPGRGNDVSLYFVLGKQPFGQFPPGWDVGLVGMCVGERRRLTIPPVLAYGSTGVPRRRIPPDATLQYDVTLVSLNGNALPQ